jgi:hypothetical protein
MLPELSRLPQRRAGGSQVCQQNSNGYSREPVAGVNHGLARSAALRSLVIWPHLIIAAERTGDRVINITCSEISRPILSNGEVPWYGATRPYPSMLTN